MTHEREKHIIMHLCGLLFKESDTPYFIASRKGIGFGNC